MKRMIFYSGPVLMAVVALGFVFLNHRQTASAAKPLDVVSWSNGFPSGEHFNLNIHGKKNDFFLSCDDSSGGGSVFVPEYGNSLIQYIQNKRSSVTELNVIDKCSSSSDDPAKVQLPKGEYQVYSRILDKPSKQGEERSVIFYPKLIETCNDTGLDDFGDATDCENSFLMGTGVITGDGVFVDAG